MEETGSINGGRIGPAQIRQPVVVIFSAAAAAPDFIHVRR